MHLSLLFHTVSDRRLSHLSGMYDYRSEATFRQDVKFLLKHYKPLRISDLSQWPHTDKSSFIITFDDGLRSLQDFALPYLREQGLAVILFIVPPWARHEEVWWRHQAAHIAESARQQGDLKTQTRLETLLRHQGAPPPAYADEIAHLQQHYPLLSASDIYLSTEELEYWQKEGMLIGAHSISHTHFRYLDSEAQLEEVCESMHWVRSQFTPSVDCFAFPYEDYFLPLDFYSELMQREGAPTYTFGTSGYKMDDASQSIQRLDVEAYQLPLPQLMRKLQWQQPLRKMLAKHKVRRR